MTAPVLSSLTGNLNLLSDMLYVWDFEMSSQVQVYSKIQQEREH